jgi:hypothetical protein
MTDLEERLFQLLELVNDWLKFGETKSGGMVVLAGLATTALLTYGSDIEDPTLWDGWTLFLAGFFFTLSLSLAVWSFLPKKGALKIGSRLEGIPDDSDNLYYYEHLAKFRATDLIEKLCELHECGPIKATRGERDLAAQIIINSRITRSKMQLFSMASVAFLIGVVVTFVSRIVAVFI